MTGSFDEIKPITLEHFKEVWPQLSCDLTAIGFTDLEFIGSTGKVPVMGDVDIAARWSGTMDEAYAKTARYFGPVYVRRVGGNILSVYAWRGHPDPFQVDIMVGDPMYLRWSRFGSSQDPHHPDFSPVKSAARNVLLNIITRFMSRDKLPYTELDRVRWSIDFDKGLYEVTQTRRGKSGKVLKSWKTTERYLMTSDPDRIVKWMFGKSIATDNTLTFEGIVGALFQSSLKEQAPQILQTFASEIRDLVGEVPHVLGDEPESVLDYIDAIAARR